MDKPQFKIDWDKLPSWANWVAKDKDDVWWCYSDKPLMDDDNWNRRYCRKCLCLGRYVDNSTVDWKDSLQSKPNMQQDQWDESLRGKKMSNNTGKVIYKYQMPVQERFTMRLPRNAEILRVADQGGMFWLWAVVDTNVPDEERYFVSIKCGANVPENRNLKYLGMCAIFVQQELALYIFEDLGEANV